MNIYETTIHIRCPFQPVWDYYRLVVESKHMIQCELIESMCDKLRGRECTQESAADELLQLFAGPVKRGFTLSLSGWHGANCKVECKRQG